MRVSWVWLLLGLTTLAAADTRTVEAPAGLIELRISAPAGADISWEARQPLDLPLRVYESSQVVVFCQHTAGKVIIQSDVIDWDARQRSKTTWIVEIEGGNPDPVPPPTPTPTRFGLEKVSKEAMASVPPGESRTLAGALADNFRGVAAACAAGGIQDVDSALAEIKRLNRATLGESVRDWEQWLLVVGKQFDQLQNDGKITTVKDYGEALSEVALGLSSSG